ncbi:hypothetical protein [Streptomyces justiciae]|uniref:Uncharacterized protein n=1 Tax=Streptomyces justiciae TaxID=2780140 RepID=A0ABU3LWQ9_9ACTN|nr:hypothetical protein [Streptomyces justiciae]MDT7843518.1 hypothetical protein [Streptomyces justiciae]
MYEYELSQLRSDDLIRRAQQDRLVREAVQGRRAARREAARREAESEVHTGRSRRHRFLRTA